MAEATAIRSRSPSRPTHAVGVHTMPPHHACPTMPAQAACLPKHACPLHDDTNPSDLSLTRTIHTILHSNVQRAGAWILAGGLAFAWHKYDENQTAAATKPSKPETFNSEGIEKWNKRVKGDVKKVV